MDEAGSGGVEAATALVAVASDEKSGATDGSEAQEDKSIDGISIGTIDESDEKITVLSLYNHNPAEKVKVYLPGVPVIAQVSSNLTSNRSRGPQFVVSLEHGPFTWKVYHHYSDFLSLRRVLAPLLRIRMGRRGRGRKRSYVPHLLSITDINPLHITRTRSQLPKVQKFMNAVLSGREFRSHRSTLKFLEISRVSFAEDLGSKRKEGYITKRSGGHERVTNCLGCTACCVCHFSVWRLRWLVLKDSYLLYTCSDGWKIAGVLLFDEGMTLATGRSETGILHGLQIKTKARTLLMKCLNRQSAKEWRESVLSVMASSGKVWVNEKRFHSFAPPRENASAQWFVDGESYMAQVANALLAAKEEIYITDWMLSPQIYLKRSKDTIHNLNYRLDKILFKKAKEGVKVFIQLYKDVSIALDLGSEYVKEEFNHPNIVLFRHPEHIKTGVFFWAHHEKIVVIDQTLAFVGGIDLAFGRYDNFQHDIHDPGYSVQLQKPEGAEPVATTTCHRWTGKDFYNPFIEEISKHHEPFEDQLNRMSNPRMPWHDVASCIFGAPARDVARHFIQRYNFTRHEQSLPHHFLLPKSEFTGSKKELHKTEHLQEVINKSPCTPTNVQVLRSVGKWSAGTSTETSILNAYLEIIEKAEHFIYIENQFFISSLKEVKNSIADALRVRIGRAYRNNETFRVIIVMPLLPSFNGDYTDKSGNVLRAVIHWNYHTISRGDDSLFSQLTKIEGVPADEIPNRISVYGLRTHEKCHDKMISEVVYVHSKCMIVDDRYTIIGSANINDRSMTGERDSEVAILVEDTDLIEGKMNGKKCSIGKFSHSLRCHLFREHLGLLEGHRHGTKSEAHIDVEDPVCERFYRAWCQTARRNMELYEKVFGGKNVPTDSVRNYHQLKSFRERPGLIGTDVAAANELLSQVQGFLVTMPLLFLENEKLLPPIASVEHIAPEMFT